VSAGKLVQGQDRCTCLFGEQVLIAEDVDGKQVPESAIEIDRFGSPGFQANSLRGLFNVSSGIQEGRLELLGNLGESVIFASPIRTNRRVISCVGSSCMFCGVHDEALLLPMSS